MAKKQATISEGHAMTYLSIARGYHKAAEQLFDQQARLNQPVNFLYSHVMELAFKAFLRSRGESIIGTELKTHELTRLYNECKKRGLVIGPDDHTEIGNVVHLLQHANKYEGLRYFNPDLKPLVRLSSFSNLTTIFLSCKKGTAAPGKNKTSNLKG